MKKTLLFLSMIMASSAAMASQGHIAGFDYQGYNFDNHKFSLSFDETKMTSSAEILDYKWELLDISGDASTQDVTIKKANKANAKFTFSGDVYQEPIVIAFKLTVSDIDGKETTDTVTYSLYPKPEQVKSGNGKKAYVWGKYYKVGDIVTYNMKKFQCVRGLTSGPASNQSLGNYVMGEPCTFGTRPDNGYEPDGIGSSAYNVWRPIGITKDYEVKPYSTQSQYKLGDRVKYNGKTYQCGGDPSTSSATMFCSHNLYKPDSYLSNQRKVWMDVDVLGNNKLTN
ncbi:MULTISPECIES: hypothetical protein [Vibrio]|uniref:PKD domain-containing protein n=1 Tax=Vibrio aestuarianus TaxID=28171 RepID=A0A9X4FGL5_9VIBR|nr:MULTISPECIES: hypothetical protein [Vibrio]MDE1211806.1 hypothetical protein [Vibrio aestuarianus]MDE1319477.1 hypothetical protein [Vibrio aestuarianus]MDE1325237.1 hypothetical protein [Vibrio aestuarianus]MDE1333515.1 hypothetical protein [Vibrio aestuarianus]MDE1347772.1 hypothetical protein [Vibrio aestuarianus]